MIKGKYIGLRAVEIEDLIVLRDWRNNSDFRRNFREHKELNLLNQEDWLKKVYSNPNDFMFVIIELESNRPIGACGLLYTNWINRSSDFSFYIGKDDLYIDDKYSFDAAFTLIKYGFEELNLNKIWMELYEYDTKKLLFFQNRFQFKVDGKLRQNAFSEGNYWDSYIISLLKSEFSV
ncbi:MAG: GNAT family N-acetyltransferase [Sediminibacterium sp.]|uniref:GNAT family N-acetyltransferase n=1 Tax=Sediminibacterium sp. TaxID=1917865 RepID=UPI00271770A0|nr:GNAT family N-acetyltransferase [Sediminibacterium sp.]MDO8997147.1 GNAT family N-acetyltransferase [Sediminibacterium sp.]